MRALASTCTLLLAVACSPSGPRGPGGSRDAGPIAPGTDTGPAVLFDTGPPRDVGPPRDAGQCSSISVAADSAIAPVDIVWIIDNSGSMSGEAEIIQNNMNNFASTIVGAGLDVHVVVITAAGFVSVPPPLGTDPMQFLRVEEDVQSHNAFEKLISTFPRWQSFIRRGSQLHLVVTTDDESDMDAGTFQPMMQSMLGRTYRFHSIVSPPGSTHMAGGFFTMDGCSGPNGDAADNGDEYWSVSSMTGGGQYSICTADWSALFTDLSRAIAVPMALPCAYEIPEPPAGEEFDPLRVNVEYTRGDGSGTETIPNVGDFSRCTGEGWYYDGGTSEMPERILLCPNTCSRAESDLSGRIDVAFGCATLLI